MENYDKKRHKETNALYYSRNKKHVNEKTLKWQKDNPERAQEIFKKAIKKYSKSPKGIYRTIKQNAKKKNREVCLQDEFILWLEKQEKTCVYCSIDESKLESRLTIERTDNDKGYQIENIALCCFDCNQVKSNKLTFEEMKIVGQIIMRKRWEKI